MKTVIFDFDGTIADSLELGIKLYHRLGDAKRPLTEERIEHLRHLPALQVAKELKVSLFRIPKLILVGRRMMADHLDEIDVFAGMPEVLQSLYQDGVELLVVSSNSAQNVQTFLERHHLDTYFTHIYGGAGIFDDEERLNELRRIDPVLAHQRPQGSAAPTARRRPQAWLAIAALIAAAALAYGMFRMTRPAVTIEDDGVGIDPVDIPRLLLPFQSQKAAGYGLGLPLSRKIALLHGATLTLTGARGRGAVATVEFLASEPAPMVQFVTTQLS